MPPRGFHVLRCVNQSHQAPGENFFAQSRTHQTRNRKRWPS